VRRYVTGVTVVGVRGHLVAVEAHVGRGLPSLTLTGLPGAGVQDARDRLEFLGG
jgi:magnesium chelatase family protein